MRAKVLHDPVPYTEITKELFNCVAAATHNRICQLMFRTVERISMRLRAMIDMPALGVEQSQDVFRRIVDAFERKDPAMAELVIVRYIEAVEQAFSTQPSPKGLLNV
jgi:DNA-binding FadR family transcriptional regulator